MRRKIEVEPESGVLLRRELKRRVNAMSSLDTFTAFTFPKYRSNWHHKLIARKLDLLRQRKIKRLMIFTPPRHGKSEIVTRRLPAFALGHDPDEQIISASYNADLARSMNRDVQRIMDDREYLKLFENTKLPDGRSSRIRTCDEFELDGARGYFRSVGICGGLTGRGFGIGTIDDPIKDRLEAMSITYRERQWDWYNSVFYTRRNDDSAVIVLVTTRWHHDDLAGRLLSQEPDQWDVIRLPALAEKENMHPEDPRQEGEALWPELFDEEQLNSIKKQIGPFEFAALYQQNPVPREGGLFDTTVFRSGHNVVASLDPALILRSIRYWDKAGTKGAGCLSAGVLMHELKDHSIVVADIVAGQWGSLEREKAIKRTAMQDGRRVKIWIEQEPGSGGKESAEATIRNLAGYVVKADRVTGDKATRAEPFSAQVNAGNVFLLDRPWLKDYLDELEMFPAGKYKDRTDASAGAFNKLFFKRISPHAGVGSSEQLATSLFTDILGKASSAEERAEMERLIANAQEKELVVV